MPSWVRIPRISKSSEHENRKDIDGMEQIKITPEQAAQVLGINPVRIRNRMRRDYLKKTNDLPIGKAYPSVTGKSFRYDIYKPLVMKYMGLTEWLKEKI